MSKSLLPVINGKIASIAKSSLNIKELSGQTALLIWQHAHETRDASPAARLLNAVKANKSLVLSLLSFFKDYSPIAVFVRDGEFKAGKLDTTRQWVEPKDVNPAAYEHALTEKEKEKRDEQARKREDKKTTAYLEAQSLREKAEKADAFKAEADKLRALSTTRAAKKALSEVEQLKAEKAALLAQVQALESELAAIKASVLTEEKQAA